MLHTLVYRSEAILPEADVSNLDIMRGALARNRAWGLTGFLHRDRNCFLQAIEGTREAVEALMERIAADRRHAAIEVLERGALAARRFRGWSMGYAGPGAFDARGGVAAMTGPEAVGFLRAAAERQAAALRGGAAPAVFGAAGGPAAAVVDLAARRTLAATRRTALPTHRRPLAAI